MAYQKFSEIWVIEQDAPALPISEPATPAKVAKPAKVVETALFSACKALAIPLLKSAKVAPPTVDADQLVERAALIQEGSGSPRAWAQGYAALSSMRVPAGFAPDRWRRIVDGAGSFVDRWASRAAEAGWSDLDIFGAHPVAPDARFDCMGLVLLLDRAEVVGIDQGGADLEARSPDRTRTRFYRRPLPPETISLWRLAVTAAKYGDAE